MTCEEQPAFPAVLGQPMDLQNRRRSSGYPIPTLAAIDKDLEGVALGLGRWLFGLVSTTRC